MDRFEIMMRCVIHGKAENPQVLGCAFKLSSRLLAKLYDLY